MNVNKVRVAFLEARYHSFYGAQRSLFTLVTNLGSTRILPVVITTGEGVVTEKYREAGIEVVILPLHDSINVFGGEILRYSVRDKFRAAFELFKFNTRFKKWLLKNDIDVVYVNDVRGLAYSCLAAKLTRKPLIWYIRGELAHSPISVVGLRLADRIIWIADGVKRKGLRGPLAKYEKKSRVLYTGFSVSSQEISGGENSVLRAQIGIPPKARIVGMVASITPNKGYDLLIEAATRIRLNNEIHYLLLGDVPPGYADYAHNLKQRISSLNLDHRFHWLGFKENVQEYYKLMDVLVLPSRSEGLPRVLIEGLASGLPVVATDVGGVRDIIKSSDLGIIVPPEDSSALAMAIEQILCDSNLKDLSVAIKRMEHVSRYFSIASYVTGFETIIYELMLERLKINI